MVSSALYDRLPSRPSINSLWNSAFDIVGVGGASVEVRGYIDVPLQIAGIKVADLLLVVSDLKFSLLIRMDVLHPHAGKMSLGSAAPLELARVSVTYASSSERTRVPRIAARRLSHVSPNSLLLLRNRRVS